MKLKKGSQEAKAFMAKLRAKRATKSKVKPKPSRIDDLLLLDEIKARQKKIGSKPINKAEIKAAIQMVVMDAIEKGYTNPKELSEYMKSNVFKKAVDNYILMFDELTKESTKKVGAVSKNKGIRAKKAYNKDVDNYKYFVVYNGKVETGFEYKNDAIYAANDFDNAKVLNLTQLKQQGFEDPRNKWKYQIGSTLKLTPKETRLGATDKDLQSKSIHKDTKSHNVNIRVVSGVNKYNLFGKTDDVSDKIKNILEWIEYYTEQLNWWQNYKPRNIEERKNRTNSIKFYKQSLAYENKHLASIKKTI
jgi:hypothetical protein